MITTLKEAFRDFLKLFDAPRTACSILSDVDKVRLHADHVQHTLGVFLVQLFRVPRGVNADEEQEECLLVACLTSQQHASVSQGRICSGNFTCFHAEIEVTDVTFYLTQSQYTDT